MDVGGVRDVTSSCPPATIQYNNKLCILCVAAIKSIIYTLLLAQLISTERVDTVCNNDVILCVYLYPVLASFKCRTQFDYNLGKLLPAIKL